MLRNIYLIIVFLCSLAGPAVFAQPVTTINIHGNHTTDSSVIMRELSFRTGYKIDSLTWPEKVKESEKNLMNTSLFVFARISWIKENNGIKVNVSVKERFYYWIYPILEHADRNLSAFFFNADWRKINYGLSFEKHNLFGKNHFLKLKARFGYREQIGILYENPAMDKLRNHGIQFYADRFRQRQVAVTNIKDKQQYYYQPEFTALNENRAGFIYFVRHGLHQKLRFSTEYHRYEVSDSLIASYPDYLFNSAQESRFFRLRLQYEFDNRDDKFFPLQGFHFLFEMKKTGLRIHPQSPDFLTAKTQIHLHHRLTNKLYYSLETNGLWHMMNVENLPWHLSGILGYDYYPRGYEYYTVHGTGMININQTLKFKLLSRKKVAIPFIPVNEFNEIHYKVFLYAFWDNAKTWYDKKYGIDNNLTGALLASAGTGIECHTFYDRSFGCHLAFTNHKAFGFFVWFHSPLYKI